MSAKFVIQTQTFVPDYAILSFAKMCRVNLPSFYEKTVKKINKPQLRIVLCSFQTTLVKVEKEQLSSQCNVVLQHRWRWATAEDSSATKHMWRMAKSVRIAQMQVTFLTKTIFIKSCPVWLKFSFVLLRKIKKRIKYWWKETVWKLSDQ